VTDKIRYALEAARDFHQHDSKMYAVIDEALGELQAAPAQRTANRIAVTMESPLGAPLRADIPDMVRTLRNPGPAAAPYRGYLGKVADVLEREARNGRHWRQECGKLHAKQQPKVTDQDRARLATAITDPTHAHATVVDMDALHQEITKIAGFWKGAKGGIFAINGMALEIAMALAPRLGAAPQLDAYDACIKIVEEACALDAPPADADVYERTMHDIGIAIRDRLRIARDGVSRVSRA
jgi:hypothetical protein